MSLLNKLQSQGSDLTFWDGTTPPPLKNTEKTQTQMHWAGPTAATDGYSLDGSPNLQIQKSDYFRYDGPQKAATIVLPTPTILDQQQSPLFVTHYPGDGELGSLRYKLSAPEGQGGLIGGAL